MTSMLEKAFSEAAKLPDVEQNTLAGRLLCNQVKGILNEMAWPQGN